MSARPVGRQARIGVALTAVAVLFLVLDSLGKLLAVRPVVEGAVQLGYPAGLTRPLGLVLLTCVLTYVVPRTSPFGAVLLTGYLGGAVATHVRVGSPLPTHVLFPVYVAVLIWGGLVLRRADLQRAFVGSWLRDAPVGEGSTTPAHVAAPDRRSA